MNAEIRPMRTGAELALLEAFPAVRDKLPGSSAVAAQRATAFGRFEARGLPHRRVEEWKYTDLRALMREAKPLAGHADAVALADAKNAGALVAAAEARKLTFVNGSFVPVLSDLAHLEPGVTIHPLSAALLASDGLVGSHLGKVVPTDDVAVALNTAFMSDGAVIHIGAEVNLPRPIHLAHVFADRHAAAAFTRSLVVVEAGARLTLIETFEGPDEIDYQINTALEIEIGDRAHVDHLKVGAEGSRALHVASVMATIGAEARFDHFAFTIGGAVTRNQMFLRVNGDGTRVGLRGANLLRGKQHADTTLVVDHAALGGESRELYKHVLDDQSRAVFQGKIIVQPGAQKTDGKMMTQALMLSPEAEVDSKPELEIFADDVVCGHGATAGELDEDLLFYLRARGIPAKEAEALLIQSFVGEAVEAVESEAVREALLAATEAWLRKRAVSVQLPI